ncbi:MAG: PAS domain S-box protein [Gammaproteobacteria bacterium]|nr:PAS domain S-box protein [Gammaproteobacteria bacterium]
MHQITDIKLIVIDEKPDSAEAIARILRDAGLLMPVNWVNSALRLQKLIETETGLIAIANANLPWLPLDQICQLCNDNRILTIALGEIPDPTLELRVLRQGATALVNPSHAGLLEQRVHQAMAQTRLHRQMVQQDKQLCDLSNRCDALLDTSKEPVAYTSEGVITSVNNAFADIVGAEEPMQLVGRLVSDFIGPESLYHFSRHLRTLMRGDSEHVQMENAAVSTLHGTVTNAHLFMDNIQVDGEHSTQIVLRDCQANSGTMGGSISQRPEASQLLNLMDMPLGKQLKDQMQTRTKPAPSLSLVHNQKAAEAKRKADLKPALEASGIGSMMARLSAWDSEGHRDDDEHHHSANDHINLEPLKEMMQAGKVNLCTQPLLGLTVLAGLLSDLPDSIRSGIHTVVLNAAETPVITQDQVQNKDWAQLVSLCQKNNIEMIAPRPDNEDQLQTWWRLGVGWCLSGDNAAFSTLQNTGTSHK